MEGNSDTEFVKHAFGPFDTLVSLDVLLFSTSFSDKLFIFIFNINNLISAYLFCGFPFTHVVITRN